MRPTGHLEFLDPDKVISLKVLFKEPIEAINRVCNSYISNKDFQTSIITSNACPNIAFDIQLKKKTRSFKGIE